MGCLEGQTLILIMQYEGSVLAFMKTSSMVVRDSPKLSIPMLILSSAERGG